MTDVQRDFKGVWIPKEVWCDTRLNALEKMILTEIDSLDSLERGCWASNKYIADFCQCSETKVSTAISKLIKLGYLYIQSFNGRGRELKSRLSNFESLPFNSCDAAFQNLKTNNTNNNTKINIEKKENIKRKETKRFTKPTVDEVRAYCVERGNSVDAERFCDYYESNGWRVGKNPMKDWKAAVRTWERNDGAAGKGNTKPQTSSIMDDYHRMEERIEKGLFGVWDE